ncbi:amidohydrolase [Thermosipho melanesiensis]|uniref:Amidohydrolase n=1 Tax=Thermosipho melanesiensis TaxID=46541 RepID=A0ABN4UYP1_9BACT|nr:amidohydrolase [Thermosipho melanesiensis]
MREYKNACVWDSGRFVKKSFYVKDNSFFGGNFNEKEVETIDLEGKYVLPGFSDSHAHVLGVGIKKLTYDVSNNSFDEIFERKDEIIIGRGWERIENEKLFDELNSMVILIRKCGHVAFLNKKSQEFLNIDRYYIFEEELEKIWNFLPEEFFYRAFKVGEREFLKHGITSVHSDDFHGISFNLLERLLKDSKLRIFEKLYTNTPWNFEYRDYGVSKIIGIKIFADGSLGGKTAYLSKPYKNTNGYGVFTLPKNFKEIVSFAEKNNLQVCVHAIGDEALSKTIKAFGKYSGHRIIHAQLVKESDFEKLRAFNLSVQPHFFFEDLEIVDNINLENILIYPFRRMYEEGILLSFSSDGPVSPIDPKYVINAALKLGFSFKDAILLYTESSGNIIKEKIGRIAPNYLADFVVYSDKNLTKLEKVFVNGELVYDTFTLEP